MAEVILKEVKKDFGKSTVINAVSIKIEEGDFCVIVGPSGCGKSTLLRIIAGLETPTNGSIIINSKDVTTVDPANRGIGKDHTNLVWNGSDNKLKCPNADFSGTITAGTFGTSSQNAYGARTVSTGNPSGGSNGDIWYKY